ESDGPILGAAPTLESRDAELAEHFAEADHTPPDVAKIERVKQWRQVANRGADARRFHTDVTDAYDARCLFSGQRLPRTSVTDSAGVDAAHILPWSTHDLNTVKNGICLNKQCHWAFD